jgi:hypothetical protein
MLASSSQGLRRDVGMRIEMGSLPVSMIKNNAFG